ncbi:discoidin domain-containing protein [Paenibacillus sp. Soil750]|uniref:discoidin domain-containing protein n=1 Tax=Paenibacillus sp. Soil750 TaxID=1736398 RepID=UPI0007018A55|nr:discoidin domain-containing protein [Paenibacillus sp. Soil750]KRE69759.1 hypothetical protein ASL11_15450 [Paenibacillus sp. Soil750]
MGLFVKRLSMTGLAFLLFVSIFMGAVGPGLVQAAGSTTLSADYDVTTGSYDKVKIQNLARGGHLTNNNLNWLPSYYDQMKEIGIKVVRIDWVITDLFYHVVSRNAVTQQLEYDFTKLDKVVLPLVERGMTPMMCLGYLPSALGGTGISGEGAPSAQGIIEFGQISGVIAQHYKNLGYTGWYWESHNEPENFNKPTTPAQVAQMYGAFATAIRGVDATAVIGGIGFRNLNIADGSWKPTFMNYLKNNPTIPFDYISVHQYGAADFSSTNIYNLFSSNNVPVKPIKYTEWNYDYTSGGAGGTQKDTNLNAAYAAKRMYDAVLRPEVDQIYYFTPVDALSPTSLFFSDSGIFTIDGHKKAVANTFEMYDNLESQIVQSSITGTNSDNKNTYGFVTKDSATGKVSMLLWNYSNTDVNMTINLSNLPYQEMGKNYKVTKKLVDSNNGNYWRDYATGLRGYPVGPSENATLKESSIQSSSGNFNRIENMTAYSVMQIVLEPTDGAPTAGPVDSTPPLPFVNVAAGRQVFARTSYENPQTGWTKNLLTDSIIFSFTMADVGNPNRGYSSLGYDTPNQTEWVSVDLGETRSINKVELYPRDDEGNSGKGFPIDFKIQGSADGGHWTDLSSYTNYNNGAAVSGVQTFNFDSANVRYVRLLSTQLSQADGKYRLQLNELKAFSAIANVTNNPSPLVYPENIAKTKTITATSSLISTGWSNAYVVDGVTQSNSSSLGWSSSSGNASNHTESLTIDLGTVNSINQVSLFPRSDAGNLGKYFPSDFNIQLSQDGVNWLKAINETDYPNPSTGNPQGFQFENKQARYVKIEGTKLRNEGGANYMMQLAEVEVYQAPHITATDVLITGDTSISHDRGNLQLSGQVIPFNVSDPTILWSVSEVNGTETDRAYVTNSGVLIANKNGQVKVTAMTADGSGTKSSIIVDITGQDISDNRLPIWGDGKVSATNLLATELTLNWTEAMPRDNVSEYRILKDGVELTTVEATYKTYEVKNLTKLTNYTFQIQAKTGTSDWSTDGPTLTLTTPDIPQPVSGVTLSAGTLSLLSGNKGQLTVTVQPTNTLNKVVHWSSSNETVATVDINGVVKGISNGNATITATTDEGGFTATSTVTVSNLLTKGKPAKAQSTGSSSSANNFVDGNTNTAWCSNSSAVPRWVRIDLGAKAKLSRADLVAFANVYKYKVEISDSETTGYTLILDKTNNSVVGPNYSDNLGDNAVGRWIQITITGVTPSSQYPCIVEFQGFGTYLTSVSGIQIDNTTLTLGQNTSAQLTATVLPEDADNQMVTWLSSDSSIASVDSLGYVTGHNAGSATITATSVDGKYTAISSISVVGKNLVNLSTAIGMAEAILDDTIIGDKEGQYTQDKVDAFIAVIENAKAVQEDLLSTQSDVNAASSALSSADLIFRNSVNTIDRGPLNAAIAQAQLIIANSVVGEDEGQYTSEIVDTLQEVLNQTLTKSSSSLSQTEAYSAVVDLQTAIDTFLGKVNGVNKNLLSSTISVAEAVYHEAIIGEFNGNYSIESKALLHIAIETASEVINDSLADQTMVNNANVALMVAIKAFNSSVVVVNKLTLSTKIAAAIDLIEHSEEGEMGSQYPLGSKALLQTALDAAEIIYNRINVSQSEVDEVVANLIAAINTFSNSVNGVNSSALDAAIQNAEELYTNSVEGTENGNYSTASREALRIAIESAHTILMDGEAEQSIVNEAVTQLNLAISLFKAAVIIKNPTPDSNNNNVNNGNVSIIDNNQHEVTVREGTLFVAPTVDAAGHVQVNIKAEDIAKAIESATGKQLVIEVSALSDSGVQSTRIDIPVQGVVDKNNEISKIVVKSGTVIITLNVNESSNILNPESKNVELTITQVDSSAFPVEIQQKINGNTVYDFNLHVNGQRVSQFEGTDSVKVETDYSPKPGENPHQIIVYSLSDDGNLSIVKTAKYDVTTGKIVWNASHFSKYAIAYNSVGFTDLAKVTWAKEIIESLAARGIINGMENGSFEPTRPVTRYEFLQILMNALDLSESQAVSKFTDVKVGSWYYEALSSAEQLGIVTGNGDGTFGGERVITREEMAVMTYRALLLNRMINTSAVSDGGYIDQAMISTYASEAIAALKGASFINGFIDGSFKPQGVATRAEAATVIFNIMLGN